MILIWDDNAYGLISWKMDLEIGHNVETHVRESRLRRLRRELRREGLPNLVRRRTAADTAHSARRRHRQRHRLPGRLLGQQRPDRRARRAGRIAVMTRLASLVVLRRRCDARWRLRNRAFESDLHCDIVFERLVDDLGTATAGVDCVRRDLEQAPGEARDRRRRHRQMDLCGREAMPELFVRRGACGHAVLHR